MLALVKKIFPNIFKQEFKDHLGVPSLSALLKHLRRIQFTPKVVFDIGAYEGYWALDLKKEFPFANIYMFEAQLSKETILAELCKKNTNFNYTIALLGALDGQQVTFDEDETASHVNIPETSTNRGNRTIATLDKIIQLQDLPLPDFLKLDVQGYELEILKGSQMALAHAEFCLLEVSLLNLGGGGPMLLDVVNQMDAYGFCAYDISQFIRRPLDGALWQIDMMFVKKNSAFLANKSWR